MTIFKKRINYNELVNLIIYIGQKRFETLNDYLKNKFEYDKNYMFYVWQIINCFLIQRMLIYKNILNNKIDIFENVLDILVNNCVTDKPDDLEMGLLQIVLEIKDIWKNDDDTNSHNEIYNTANYFINEITDKYDDSKFIIYKKYIEQFLIDCHFENKKIISEFKIQV